MPKPKVLNRFVPDVAYIILSCTRPHSSRQMAAIPRNPPDGMAKTCEHSPHNMRQCNATLGRKKQELSSLVRDRHNFGQHGGEGAGRRRRCRFPCSRFLVAKRRQLLSRNCRLNNAPSFLLALFIHWITANLYGFSSVCSTCPLASQNGQCKTLPSNI